LEKIGKFKLLNLEMEYGNLEEMKEEINSILKMNCKLLEKIIYSNSAESVEDL
jgi:hypothetical protein